MKTNLFLLLLIATLFSCNKITDPEELASLTNSKPPISREDFITKTKSLLTGREGFANRDTINEYIDYSTTTYYEWYKGTDTSRWYYTKIYNTSSSIVEDGGLVSVLLDSNKVLHTIIKVQNHPNGSFTNYFSDIETKDLGRVDVDSIGTVTDVYVIAEQPGDNEYTEFGRSWFSCTQDCIGDAHTACYQNTTCQVLLFATNIGSNFASPKGLGGGTVSIAVACAGACLKNRNLDLLPQY